MADPVVSFLLDNLSRLLVEEVKLLSDVNGKVASLAKELKFIEIFLKSSEGNRNDPIVKEVVNQIRDAAYEAEDVVDTYVANVTLNKMRNIFNKLFHCIDHGMMLHDVNAQIESIKSTIDEIYKNKERYGIGEGEFTTEEAASSIRKRREKVEEDDVVGLEHDSDIVIEKLMAKDSHDLNVVSIIGMGGLGKTTLARKIYNNVHVKREFPNRAWGYVSNDYRAKEFLLSLLKCLMSSSTFGCQDLSEEELKEKVRQHLRGNKYLVVLDDMWKTETWDEIKDAFPDDHRSSSRILITTRMKEVSSHVGTTFTYNLPFLNEHDSWKLFSKKAFPREECPSGLENLGKSIVQACGGLPLAIVVLAGILAKKNESEREMWLRSFENHVNWHISQNPNKVMDILKLSYDSLPPKLKPCFLYLGIYPEDYEIPVRQLIQLWISEGFIQLPQETGISNAPELEEVADQYYLNELVDRSLVQVASRRSDGGVKTCRVHDLLRDLCITESKADKSLEVCTESNIDILGKSNPRRLSLHCRLQQGYLSSYESEKLRTRSLFSFQGYNEFIKKKLKVQLVRVLLLEKMKFQHPFYSMMFFGPPHNLEMMVHLRYLRISYGMSMPTSVISRLWNLETLDVRETHIPCISEIWKLKRLRHVYIKGNDTLPAKNSSRLSSKTIMQNLQTLCWVNLDQQIASLFDNHCFPKLRKLGLWYYGGEHIVPLRQLQSLHRLRNLGTLKIRGSTLLPLDVNAFPSNLTKITLTEFGTLDKFINTLGKLPKLQILKLSHGKISGDVLKCASEEFPQIHVFQMRFMEVKRWILEKGSMPHLRVLDIMNCKELRELPQELWSLTSLQQVNANWASKELENHLQRIEVKKGCKLIISKPHIPPPPPPPPPPPLW